MDIEKIFNKKDKKEVRDNKSLGLPDDYLYLQQSIQEFMPFENIADSMIWLPNDLFRVVIEVSSINYYLKTVNEQETIEAQFKNALSSWDFSFAFYTQTRTLDAEDLINSLKEDVSKIENSRLKAYGVQYIDAMRELTSRTNGNLIKKNYIIISCNDAGMIANNKTQEEKANYAFDKLNLNIRKVIESLSPIGLNCRVLHNEELIELMFVALNKHNMLKPEDIIDFTSNLTVGKTEWDVDKVNMLIDGVINQINNMIASDIDLDGTEIQKAQETIKKLQKIKDDNGQYKESGMFVL